MWHFPWDDISYGRIFLYAGFYVHRNWQLNQISAEKGTLPRPKGQKRMMYSVQDAQHDHFWGVI